MARKKDDLMLMVERTSKEACKAIDEACFNLCRKYGYDPTKIRQCKSKMKKDYVGIVECSSVQDGSIYFWWELHKFDEKYNKKPVELIDKSEVIEIKAKMNVIGG